MKLLEIATVEIRASKRSNESQIEITSLEAGRRTKQCSTTRQLLREF
jgi:hypothetical protein